VAGSEGDAEEAAEDEGFSAAPATGSELVAGPADREE
jgi:hypothetical protein